MAKMTHEQFEACYKLGKQAYEKEGSDNEVVKEAAISLVDDYQMNEASAKMYINFFLCMMRGEVYERSINQKSFKHW